MISIEIMRLLTPTQRSEVSAALTAEFRSASKLTIAKLHPEFTSREVELKFIEIHYGKELADAVREWKKMRTDLQNSDCIENKDNATSN